MSVDLRTRVDGHHETVDPEQFFQRDLPAALDAYRDAVAPGIEWLDLRPMLIEVDGEAWTLSVHGDRVHVDGGSQPGAGRVRLEPGQLDGLVHDQQTFMGMWSSGRLDQRAGRLGDALDWWLVLRAALDGRPIHEPGAVTFLDLDGGPLDLHHTFGPVDDRDDMRHFLEEAGYLHIQGLFTEEEMGAVSEDMDRAAPTYAPDDGRSWWAKTADGERKLVRMQGFDEHSPSTKALIADPRFLGLAEIPGDGHAFGARSNNRIEALFKPIGIVEGISDVPWHKDCSLGRHSYECCSLTVGISVTGAASRTARRRARPSAAAFGSIGGSENPLYITRRSRSTGGWAICRVQLRCTVTSPVLVGRSTTGRSQPGWSSADHISARCDPARTRSWPDTSSAPVTEIPTVRLQHSYE